MVCTNILNTLRVVFVKGYVTTGFLQLTPEVVYSCPGERVTFSCVVTTGSELFWEVDYVYLSDSSKQRFLASDQPGRTIYLLNSEGHVFEFTLVSTSPLTSNATTIMVSELNGTLVYCEDATSAKTTSAIYIISGTLSVSLLIHSEQL